MRDRCNELACCGAALERRDLVTVTSSNELEHRLLVLRLALRQGGISLFEADALGLSLERRIEDFE